MKGRIATIVDIEVIIPVMHRVRIVMIVKNGGKLMNYYEKHLFLIMTIGLSGITLMGALIVWTV